MLLHVALEDTRTDQIGRAIDSMYQCLGIVDDERAAGDPLAQPSDEMFAGGNYSGAAGGELQVKRG